MNPSTWLSLVFVSHALARESAWNGKTPFGSDAPKVFLPFYVPPGAKSYDSSSPLIQYRGLWSQSYSSSYIGATSRWTDEPGARVSLPFVGTGIEWFGSQDRTHGIAVVLIDGQQVDAIDAWSYTPRTQQRLFSKYDLPYGKHLFEIEHTGRGAEGVASPITDINAMIVTKGHDYGSSLSAPTGLDNGAQDDDGSQWSVVQRGSTGVAAMQLVVISSSHALIIDKVEHNPISIDGHPAWGALYNLDTQAVMPLKIQSNSFCAGGTFLSNGTLINVGGNPVIEDFTSPADFGHLDGLQAVRLFHPCPSSDVSRCYMYENHARIRMASPRWYNTAIRLSDGSAMIIGGSKKGGWINNATVNNPTVEYWPPKSIHGSNGLPIHLPFLVDTLNANLFPIAFTLPDDKVFMAANRDAMIYDWKTNTEQRLPRIPNGVRVTYPMTGVGLLLPLSPGNYTPEILICGGSAIDDTTPGYEISSQDPASNQCSRITLTEAGIAVGWEVERLPEPRHMPDAVLLPTGQVFIVNGAKSGISGYGNVKDQVGVSNADSPNLTPVLYTPDAPPGQRFSTVGMKPSLIPRMYHSVATLTPAADILVAGSNPNLDRSEVKYGTEYRVERFQPPYMTADRPIITQLPHNIYYAQPLEIDVIIPSGVNATEPTIKVALMDLGFVTHAVHANSRLVYLTVSSFRNGEGMIAVGPPDGSIYPPGPGWIFLVVNGVPSQGKMVMVGDGQGPPVDESAWENRLSLTSTRSLRRKVKLTERSD
ncbi:glyoxal oxidase N-terminus-domain-containing protein [Boletus edulis]|nr:glyoxal oxidase N-terminus-domain-containing protein [Boletus edulis]